MPDAVNPAVIDSVASANFKTLGDGAAFYSGLAMSNAISHQQRMQTISEASVGRLVKAIVEPDVGEALASNQIATSDLPSHVSSLLSALSSAQQAAKVAQTTPPSMS